MGQSGKPGGKEKLGHRKSRMDIRIKKILRLLKQYDPEKVILFGSFARGSSDQFSDIDLIIIKKTRRRFIDRIKDVLMIIKPNYAIDILVYTPEEFKKMLSQGNPFLEYVMKEGKVIYERS